jgi:hypothetical protein
MYSYHYTAADLKRRGWTDALISYFVPVPDDTTPNPWYNRAAPIRLYLQTKIAEIEHSEEWQAKVIEAKKRKARAKQGSITKLEKMKREVEEMVVKIPCIDEEELIQRACDHYNDRKLTLLIERGFEYTPAVPSSDPSFLHRITVNYIRHELSPYDRKLAARYGKVGVRIHCYLISRKIFEAIADTYPWLADECEQQLRSRENGVI